VFDRVTWPAVAMVAVIMAGLFGLAYIHGDMSVVLSALSLLTSAGVGGLVMQLRTNVNGSQSQRDQANAQLIATALDRLAQTQPVPTQPDAAEVASV
jgi:hypothetical protein